MKPYYRAPWEVWEAVNPDDPCAYRIDPKAQDGEIVAWTDDEQCARLIAAAPELLEALERVRWAFYVDGTTKALRKAFEGTKELVAKAKGAP